MEPTPKMVQMTMGEAMDLLDEFGITEKDYDRVMAAMEMVFSGKAEPEPPGEMEDASEQQAFGDVFARKGM
jgi:hypothetical protein